MTLRYCTDSEGGTLYKILFVCKKMMRKRSWVTPSQLAFQSVCVKRIKCIFNKIYWKWELLYFKKIVAPCLDYSDHIFAMLTSGVSLIFPSWILTITRPLQQQQQQQQHQATPQHDYDDRHVYYPCPRYTIDAWNNKWFHFIEHWKQTFVHRFYQNHHHNVVVISVSIQ